LGATKDKSPCALVDLAPETETLLVNARQESRAQNLYMIVANDVSREDAGFEADTNRKLIYRDGQVEDLPLITKDEVADLVLDSTKALTRHKGRQKF